jgi:hypothetical protein
MASLRCSRLELKTYTIFQQGVTSINTLIDVVTWFSQNIFADLQAESSAVHPILQVDAIKYLYTFRNQVRHFVRSGNASTT